MSPLSLNHSRFTLRTFLYGFLVLLLLGGFIAYTSFQARFLIEGPQVDLTGPTAGVSSERVIALEGTAANIARMSLNGRPIYTNEEGYFKEMIVLENGYTTATIRAEDRYGRIVSVERDFVFTPPPKDAVAQAADEAMHY